MSYYYKQEYISPSAIFARVQEELKSYFDSNIVDTTLFPIWTNDCLQKLGLAAYPIIPAVIFVENYQARLPDDFKYAREVWMCAKWEKDYQLPSSIYQQLTSSTIGLISSRLDAPDVFCDVNCNYPDIIQAIYKTTQQVALEFKKQYLLTPGNIDSACPKDLYCANYNSVAPNSYDIRDNKLVTTFECGPVYMLYYANSLDEGDVQLIPDELRQRNFIEAYLKQKVFEQVFNQTTDESFFHYRDNNRQNQSQQKYIYYKGLADEAYILANTENRKEDVYRKQRKIRQTLTRNRKYEIGF